MHGSFPKGVVIGAGLAVAAVITGAVIAIKMSDGGKLKYNEDELIGRGSNGVVVYKGKFQGNPVAVKRFQKSSIISESDVKTEGDLLKRACDHPNIIRFLDYGADDKFM